LSYLNNQIDLMQTGNLRGTHDKPVAYFDSPTCPKLQGHVVVAAAFFH
jgi:hypothetical protein